MATGLTGTELRSALHQIIDEHVVLSYGDTDEAMYKTDAAPDNAARLILIYTRESKTPADWINNSSDGWNREHMWPNSLGIDKQYPAYTDLHHYVPAIPT